MRVNKVIKKRESKTSQDIPATKERGKRPLSHVVAIRYCRLHAPIKPVQKEKQHGAALAMYKHDTKPRIRSG